MRHDAFLVQITRHVEANIRQVAAHAPAQRLKGIFGAQRVFIPQPVIDPEGGAALPCPWRRVDAPVLRVPNAQRRQHLAVIGRNHEAVRV